jgi:hypothetical protein
MKQRIKEKRLAEHRKTFEAQMQQQQEMMALRALFTKSPIAQAVSAVCQGMRSK